MTAITLYDPKQLAEQISNQQNTIRILAGLIGNSDITPVMRDDVHFGKIPGTDKPTLLKPGAELLCRTFGLYADYESMTQIEDFGSKDKEPLFYYRYKCILRRIEDNAIVATGIGSCNSRESKYGYRWIPEHEVPPNLDKSKLNTRVDSIEEFDFAIDKAETTGKYGKPAEYWQEFKDAIANGTADKFKKSTKGGKQFDAYRITSVTYQVPNPEIASQVNTIDKMAQKRCLSGSTPVVIKTSRGISRTKIETLHTIFQNGNEEVFIAGTDGEWRRVVAVVKTGKRNTKRVTLADGSYVLATDNHRFPTTNGLKHVSELAVGDTFLRDVIPSTEPSKVDCEIAWVAGLFLAEGSFSETAHAARFTLHIDETGYVDRVTQLAERVGATWNITQKKGKCISLNIHGQGFVGLMKDFVSGKGSYRKHFSKRAFNQGREFLRAMLHGYLAGDGSWTDRQGRVPHWRIGFTGENRELAKDLRTVCAMLGLRFKLARSTAKSRRIEFPTYVGWIKFEEPKYNGKTLETITSISDEPYISAVYDIEVDGNHLFLLANGIVTHNSLIAATLNGTAASEFFTQDGEDLPEFDRRTTKAQPEQTDVIEGEFEDVTDEKPKSKRDMVWDIIEHNGYFDNRTAFDEYMVELVKGNKIKPSDTLTDMVTFITHDKNPPAESAQETEKTNLEKAYDKMTADFDSFDAFKDWMMLHDIKFGRLSTVDTIMQVVRDKLEEIRGNVA